MIRYLRLYLHFLRFSFSRAMEFRMDFFFRVIMDLCFYVTNIIFFKVIFLHTPLIGGWSEKQVLFFVSGYLLIDAANMTFFSNNQWALASLINRGDLDYYLIRPISSLFFVSVRDFAANSFMNLLCAIGIVFWAGLSGPEAFSIFQIVKYLFFLGFGLVLYHCLYVMLIMVVFWTHSSRGFSNMFWVMTRVMERPDGIYRGWFRRFVTTIFPMAIIASFPARMVFEPANLELALHFFGVVGVFFILMVAVWRMGLRAYTSASS